jgi:outer membrane immunogenic protein
VFGNASTGSLNTSSNGSGWTVGGGVETKLWNSNWSAKLEYLYVDLGSVTTAFAVGGPFVFGGVAYHTVTTANFRDNIVRVGLNYQLR